MLRPGLALAAAALVGAASLSPSGAAPLDGLVVDAARSAYVDVEIDEATQVDPSRPMRVEGGGRFVSVLVMPLDPEPPQPALAAGSTLFRDIADRPLSDGFGDLPRGRYRVVVLTDRPVRVVLPVAEGERGLHVRVTRSVSARYAFGRAALTAPGPSGGEVRLTDAVPAGHTSRLVTRVQGERLEQVGLCAAARGARCRGQLLPMSLPSPLPPQPDVTPPSGGTGTTYRSTLVAPVGAVRDGLVRLDGLRTTPSDAVLAVLSFRLP